VPDLRDRDLVAREFAGEERLVGRRLDRWADYRAPDPREVALAALAEGRPRRVLEIGPGTGELAERVRDELRCEVVCVDVSPRMVELARARGLEAFVADVVDLPFEPASFDAALAAWGVYFVAHLDRALAELARVLRGGGRLVAITNSDEHLRELWAPLGLARPLSFSAENGGETLGRRFARVERRDTAGEVVFPTREALLGYLGAFRELYGHDVAARLPDVELPFRASVRNAVFVADTP
jgi:SAM-dependent methyltransferase